MTSRTRLLSLAVLALLLGGGAVLVARSGSDETSEVAETTTSTASTTTIAPTTAAPAPPPSTTTTTEPQPTWPDLPDDGVPRAVVTPSGLVLAVEAADGDAYTVRTPCGGEARVTGTPITGAHVVLDPGHGGDEPGAVGPNGLTEKEVNQLVAEETQRQLEALGATVVLTRTADYRITLASRAAIVTSLRPLVFISIHHNADPDEERPTPGAETYFQIASPDSKRVAGLLHEELVAAFAPYDVTWAADLDAGAKYRPAGDGGDYYGILRRTAGVPAVLSEAAFISNPAEEALLRDPVFHAVQAEAITSAVVRFVTSDDPGSGFVEPYPRTQPAGPGGGGQGCVDPPLG
ncbi:MAG: N-acetylmuramoyl-L-alanine amidase family protein [Acidimicrobiales bacterium]